MNALSLFTSKSFEFSNHLLTEKGADVNIKNFAGNSIFHKLAMMNPLQKSKSQKFIDYKKYCDMKKFDIELYKRFFNLYLSNGIDINEKNVAGDTPLSIALREKNFVFLDLLTQQENLNVDHLVHEKSELHYFKSIVFHKRAPEILERIIKKSKDFKLLMQLYNMDNGFNPFHSILNEIVNGFYGNLDTIKAQLSSKYHKYLQLFNSKSSSKINFGEQKIREEEDYYEEDYEDEDDEDYEDEEDSNSNKIVEENNDMEMNDNSEIDFNKLTQKVKKAKQKFLNKNIKTNLLELLKVKAEYYQPKHQIHIMKKEEELVKDRILHILNIFDKNRYNFNEKVRLYKRPAKDKNLVEKAQDHMMSFGRNTTVKKVSNDRIKWRNKDYTVNKDAKSSVFHILMKKANIFLFEYFYKKLKFKSNECNFLGNSLIHCLVKNYTGKKPKMDIKVYNEDYDRLKQKQLEKEKQKASKQNQMLENNNQDQPVQFGGLGTGASLFGGTSGYISNRPVKAKTRRSMVKKKSAFKSSRYQLKQKVASFNVEEATKVHSEIEEQTIMILKRLFELKEDPDLQNKEREYPILKACRNGGNDLLHLMVSNNADLNVRDKKGETPLLIFAKRRDVQSCEYLLEHKAEINLSDKKGRNALHWSLNMTTPENSNNFDLEELLIQRGINVNKKDLIGKPPIFYLFTKIHNEFINEKLDPIEIFSYLLSMKKIDLEAIDKNGNRLIHWCAQRGSYLCMIYLLKAGVSVKVLNVHGNSPLNISILNNQNDVAIILLQHDSEVNQSVQIVDYDSLRKYKKLKREKRKKEKENSEKKIIEEKSDSESEEEVEENELEDNEGLIAGAVTQKFKEDDESEDEDSWEDYAKQRRSKRGKKKASVRFEIEEEETESEDEDEDFQEKKRQTHYTHYRYNNRNYVGVMSSWQIQSIKNQLQQTIKEKEEKKKEWNRLEKLSKNNFITGKESQFKIALKNSMLSVNFLLIDFQFDMSRAVMDTFSLQNWDYSRTLLNKKSVLNKLISLDSKGRNALHYLAYFGNSLNFKKLEFFYEKLIAKGQNLNQKDCFGRKPIHYAALSGNLSFIDMVKDNDDGLHEKDIFGNSLLSLFLQSHSANRNKLEIFIKEYNNDLNVVFKVSDNKFIKELESFNELAQENMDPEKELKKLLKKKGNTFKWFETEKKFREGETVPKTQEYPFKLFSTLIYMAIEKNNLTLTEDLIDLGADINLKDQEGKTLLAKAIESNNLNLLEILKKHKNLIDFSLGKFI
jgi:ankyrin repeat protein